MPLSKMLDREVATDSSFLEDWFDSTHVGSASTRMCKFDSIWFQ